MEIGDAKLTVSAKDNTKKGFDKVNKSTKNMAANFRKAGLAITAMGAGLVLVLGKMVNSYSKAGDEVAKITRFTKRGKFADRITEDGTRYEAYVFAVGDDCLFIVANKYCEFFSKGQQCLYCDLTPHAAEQKRGGEAMVLRKEFDKVAEVLFAP